MKSLAFYFQSVLWELFWHYLGITFGNFFINFINFYFFSTSLLEIYLWTPAFSFVIPPAFLRQFPWRTFTNYFQYLGKARCSEKKKKYVTVPEEIPEKFQSKLSEKFLQEIPGEFIQEFEVDLKKKLSNFWRNWHFSVFFVLVISLEVPLEAFVETHSINSSGFLLKTSSDLLIISLVFLQIFH